MYLFIETVCYLDGQPTMLALHQQRLDRTFQSYFPEAKPHQLHQLLPEIPDDSRFKCRVVYDGDSISVEYTPYLIPKIKSLRVVICDDAAYAYKSEDRSKLVELFERRGAADDVLIVKNGMVTDSYFANVAFYDGNEWFTPETCLLEGVKRKSLIMQGLLKVRAISLQDISRYEKVSLINAMLDLGEVEINVNSIILN
ncbi:aminotransferase class IV [Reichenbachiella agarivorans]|uniref:Aminotransferase class IV n=1 Tax=Reichenbachiella agarivorans TaxID=2979464 RepID=A0ABY6CKN3_9BACT|nr:aminotransferase class IV [Reichenbachiella agarivorans]UXP31087.1 aminotransferase class IV [Reichenbachiella agarivorans]